MSKAERNSKLLVEWLQKNKHKCMENNQTWCGSPFCKRTYTKDFKRVDYVNMEFARLLENCGHTCVMIIDTIPLTISWCKMAVCCNEY